MLSVRSRREELRGEVLKSERELTILQQVPRIHWGTTTNLLPSDAAGWEADLGLPGHRRPSTRYTQFTPISLLAGTVSAGPLEARAGKHGARLHAGVVSQSFGFQRLPEARGSAGKERPLSIGSDRHRYTLVLRGARARVVLKPIGRKPDSCRKQNRSGPA